MTASTELVRLARRLREGIDADRRAQAKRLIRDSIGISVAAGALSAPARAAAEAAADGADGSCSVWVRAGGLPPAAAAFVNSAAAHSLDYDDTHDLARLHTTTVTLPPALAMAEHVDAAGADLLDAFIVASEIMCRIGLAAKPKGTGPTSMWFMTQLAGYFGATLSAGLVAGLDDDGLVSALGIALSEAAGAKQTAIGVGSNMRSIYPAFAASAGVTSAQLARAGMVGPAEALEGPAGLWPAFMGAELDAEVLDVLVGHPERWEFDEIAIKPWPSCRMAHPYIDAVFSLPARDIAPDEIRIGVNASAHRLCVPEKPRRSPTTLPDACFSIPFMTAVAIVKRRVDLATITPELLDDPEVRRVAARVRAELTLEDAPGNPAGTVAIRYGDALLEATGDPIPRPSDRVVEEKFRDCLAQAGAGAGAEAVWETVGRIDALAAKDFAATVRRALSPERGMGSE